MGAGESSARSLKLTPPARAAPAPQVARKKEASRRVKDLREQIGGHSNDASDLEAQQQHLLRQQATLKDRIRKLESQARARARARDRTAAPRIRLG